MSKSDKKWPSYTNAKLGQRWRPGLFWAENWILWPYFLFFPSFAFIFKVKPNYKSIGPKLPFFPLESAKSLHFSMSLFETFRINVNMVFANNVRKQIFVLAFQKIFERKIQQKNDYERFLDFWLNFFKGLNQKSASYFICEIPYLHRF